MPSIDPDVAAALVAETVQRARGEGVGVSVAVTDEVGALLAFQRMAGAPRFSADFAAAKARTSATFATATSALEDLYKDRPAFAHSFVAQGNYFLGRGGLPIYAGADLIGAIGVSGATAHGEEALAVAVVASATGLATSADHA